MRSQVQPPVQKGSAVNLDLFDQSSVQSLVLKTAKDREEKLSLDNIFRSFTFINSPSCNASTKISSAHNLSFPSKLFRLLFSKIIRCLLATLLPISPQPVLLQGIMSSQIHDFSFALDEFHKINIAFYSSLTITLCLVALLIMF